MSALSTTLVLVLAGMTIVGTTAVAREPLATDLSEHEIAITSDFNGMDLLLFGSTGDPGLLGAGGQ
ncbi:MAG: TIGR02186 family protein, partial [Gammaproteobacteria bacterium]